MRGPERFRVVLSKVLPCSGVGPWDSCPVMPPPPGPLRVHSPKSQSPDTMGQ